MGNTNQKASAIIMLTAVLLLISVYLFQVKKAGAVTIAIGPQLNFGGQILDTRNCYCSFNTIIKVGDPQGGKFSKPFSIINNALGAVDVNLTTIYDYGKVDKDRMVLGDASLLIPLPCLQFYFIPVPPFVKCDRDKDYNLVYPLINKIGTNQ